MLEIEAKKIMIEFTRKENEIIKYYDKQEAVQEVIGVDIKSEEKPKLRKIKTYGELRKSQMKTFIDNFDKDSNHKDKRKRQDE